ncbi:ABC transporter ATP-binding protein [Nonomuraea sp. NPDC050536]|uniref:ABC transporter ATP-binding protein n=1 Tax=Nonomuraea sp. NPDC050536 TaxID=3364366 RepID=UPI0037CB0543
MALLEIENLSVRLAGPDAARPILDEVSLHVAQGEAVGLVGESGSGKSVTCRAVLGLLPGGAETSGSVRVGGEDVLAMPAERIRALRRTRAAMIFQDPRASINAVRRIGDFVTEGLRAGGTPYKMALERAVELLEAVGIQEPRAALRRYPHQFSGGMLQRVMIAGALAAEPPLLLADEPTTALDVSTQAEVIAILARLRAEREMGMLFVTHDLELASAICDRIYVMYAGRIVEEQATAELFHRPRHPYTAGLLAATPRLESETPPHGIPGRPLSLADSPPGCAFAQRCAHAHDRCDEQRPELRTLDGASVACLRAEEVG